MKKLQATRIPAYDPNADLTPLVALFKELAAVRRRIQRTTRSSIRSCISCMG
jgi:hypothetical protein